MFSFNTTVQTVLADFNKLIANLEKADLFHKAEAEVIAAKQEALQIEQQVHEEAVAQIARVKAKVQELIG